MQHAFDDYFLAVDLIDRNCRVNTEGWSDDGRPIGGHLTWDAVAEINEARYSLSEATGLDYDWLRFNGF